MTRTRWAAALLAALGLLIVARDLAGLAWLPHGFYTDEASIAYNAWAVATTGRDEHGYVMPLYFEAFGEWKNPVYIYALALLLKFAPLTIAVSRLPAAFFALVTSGAAALAGWRLTRSRTATVLALALAGSMPWLTLLGRIAFEVISMVGLLAAAVTLLLWDEQPKARWFLPGSILLAISTFAYSVGRLETFVLVGALVGALGWEYRRTPWRALIRSWSAPAIVPSLCAYAVLLAWSTAFPGALLSRFNGVSVFAFGAGPVLGLERFVLNYLTYLSPSYLFLTGDPDMRQSTHYEGMLLVASAPFLIAGIAAAIRSFRVSWRSRFLLFGLLAAPVSAALTEESTPHGLRSAVMIPFLLCLMAMGAASLVPWLVSRRKDLAFLLLALLAVEAVFWNADLFTGYADRSTIEYDTGEVPAVAAALDLARGRPLIISPSVPDAYIYLDFVRPVPPPLSPLADSETYALTAHNAFIESPGTALTPPGAVILTTAVSSLPSDAVVVRTFTARAPTDGIVGARETTFTTFVVARVS